VKDLVPVFSPDPDSSDPDVRIQPVLGSYARYTSRMGAISAVVTTGIYCRPGRSARPRTENVRAFPLAAAAAGRRPSGVPSLSGAGAVSGDSRAAVSALTCAGHERSESSTRTGVADEREPDRVGEDAPTPVEEPVLEREDAREFVHA
jgi:methylphosphotriester-DNA--protein-cysteine methyltransferase